MGGLTHCLGCEHFFDGDLAQTIAEKVFASLTTSAPDKPQVHYLLGYLRSEQGRTVEALASYRRAVTLDPDYLDAWKQMALLAGDGKVSAAKRREISGAILRLDPLQKHVRAEPLGDLRDRWRQVDRALAGQRTQGVTRAYRFRAAAASREQVRPEFGRMDVLEYQGDFRGETPKSAGGAVASDQLVQTILQLIEQSRSAMEEEPLATK